MGKVGKNESKAKRLEEHSCMGLKKKKKIAKIPHPPSCQHFSNGSSFMPNQCRLNEKGS